MFVAAAVAAAATALDGMPRAATETRVCLHVKLLFVVATRRVLNHILCHFSFLLVFICFSHFSSVYFIYFLIFHFIWVLRGICLGCWSIEWYANRKKNSNFYRLICVFDSLLFSSLFVHFEITFFGREEKCWLFFLCSIVWFVIVFVYLPFRETTECISWLAAEYVFIKTLCVMAGSSVCPPLLMRPLRPPVVQWLNTFDIVALKPSIHHSSISSAVRCSWFYAFSSSLTSDTVHRWGLCNLWNRLTHSPIDISVLCRCCIDLLDMTMATPTAPQPSCILRESYKLLKSAKIQK